MDLLYKDQPMRGCDNVFIKCLHAYVFLQNNQRECDELESVRRNHMEFLLSTIRSIIGSITEISFKKQKMGVDGKEPPVQHCRVLQCREDRQVCYDNFFLIHEMSESFFL